MSDDAPVWPKILKLKTPIVFGDLTITELTLQKGKLGIIKEVRLVPGEVKMTDLILIASRLSGQPTQVIELLDPDDSPEVMSIALSFYGKSLAGIAL